MRNLYTSLVCCLESNLVQLTVPSLTKSGRCVTFVLSQLSCIAHKFLADAIRGVARIRLILSGAAKPLSGGPWQREQRTVQCLAQNQPSILSQRIRTMKKLVTVAVSRAWLFAKVIASPQMRSRSQHMLRESYPCRH